MTTASPTTLTPTTIAELHDAVLDQPGPLGVAGAGTAADWAGEPDPVSAVVSTTALSGVVTHNPGDMTVAVRAGTPLTALQEVLGEHGQRVALDPARLTGGATVGGLFATADSGPLALTYGSLRDLVIGATVVLADGTVARSGGHVIKNVAGYDLTKILHGAHGTLGIVSELVLRLHPLSEAAATVALPCPRALMTERAAAVAATPVEAVAVQWHDDRLLVRLEGTRRGVDGRVRRLCEALTDAGIDGAAPLDDPDADTAWAAHAAAVSGRPTDGAVLRFGVAPSRLAETLDQLGALRAITAAPSTGVATVTLPADPDAVRAAHNRVAAAGGTSSLRQRSATGLPAWGPPPSSVALLRAVAASLDPDHRLGRGRLAPWLTAPTGGMP